jgi:U3 small nucleolar RNA-associated protein 10
MLHNSDVARFVAAILPNALTGGYAHHTMLAFNAATLHDFIIRSKYLDQGTLAFLLPALLEPLQKHTPDPDSTPKDAIACIPFLPFPRTSSD